MLLMLSSEMALCVNKLNFLRFYKRNCSTAFNFVPKHEPVVESDVRALEEFITNSKQIVVITGAGISTESGIPDYRSAEVGLYARSNHKPTQYLEFLKSAVIRQRYWARNYVGWPRFSQREPNITHKIIRDLEVDHNKITAVITQNVDRLHHKAGSKNVIELHGHGYQVICLGCDNVIDRFQFQHTLDKLNPNVVHTSHEIRPDGDVDLSDEQVTNFKLPSCENCGGILKPDIVFFGDNVPRDRIMAAAQYVYDSDALLVLGSSLTVFSAYRYILLAEELDKKIGIINIGDTRGDAHAMLKISAKCGDILQKISLS